MLLKSWHLMLSWGAGAPTESLFSRLWLSGAGSAGVGIFFPEFPLSVFCWVWSGIEVSAWHSKSSTVSPCQDSSAYPKILHAKFHAAVSPFHVVRTERGALASPCLHLQGAGNASFSPCPLKTWGWGVLPTKGGNTRQVGCWQLLVAVSPQGMRLFRVCWNESMQWIRSTVTAPRQKNLSHPFQREFHAGDSLVSSNKPTWIISWSYPWWFLVLRVLIHQSIYLHWLPG